MLHHEVGEPISVDKNNSLRQMASEVDGRGGEAGCRDEDASGGTDSDEATEEALDLGPTDGDMRIVALGLHIDAVEAEAVLVITPSMPPSPDLPSRRAAFSWLPP